MGKLTLFACVALPRDHIQRRHKLSFWMLLSWLLAQIGFNKNR
jgi:hypothetical protein